jgi:hypothetical protein
MSEDFKEITWTTQLEEHFASTGEKAHCLSWCHKKAEEKYSRLRTFIDLPVIALSSICGFLQVGSETMFNDSQTSSIALGSLSLFTALLASTQTYFKFAARAENHRLVAIQWSRLYRFLQIEMSLPRDERKPPHDLLRDTKDTVDRLQEISPLIPPDVIDMFKTNFAKEKEISKPEETNGLEKITIYTENPLRKVDSFVSIDGTPNPGNPRRKQAERQTDGDAQLQGAPETAR